MNQRYTIQFQAYGTFADSENIAPLSYSLTFLRVLRLRSFSRQSIRSAYRADSADLSALYIQQP
jgi:hypothetical protein